MSEQFYKSVYGDTKGWVSLVTRSEDGEINSERWVEYPAQLSFMGKYTELRQDEDVYYSVGVFSGKARTMDDTSAVCQVVYADADTCHPDNFRLIPTWSIQTSEGHWHCVWVLDRPYTAKECSDVSRRVYNAHESQGCDRGWIQSKLLRVPGTTNTKRDDPEPVIGTFTDVSYTLDQFNEAYADTPVAPTLQVANTKAPKPVSDDRLREIEDMLSPEQGDLYTMRPTEGQSWSERMFRFELDMFRMGLTAQEVFSLMLEAPVNKYNWENAGQLTQQGVPIPKRNNPGAVLWKEVLKAEAEFKATEYIQQDESRAPAAARSSFLTMEEKEIVRDNPTYIDDYVAWALAKSPDSAAEYHRSLALVTLSSCFSDRVYYRMKWGPTFPNLWSLVVGPTTRTRKSTSVGFYKKIIAGVEQIEAITINIGSNATPEALTTLLGTRDGEISALITDEVQSLFAESAVKNYMVGTFDTYTKLYDGDVEVSLRNTKGAGNRNRAKTRFLFVGLGVPDGIARALKRENFTSGFLTRFTWAVADAAPYVSGSEDWVQPERDDNDYNSFDMSFIERAEDLVTRRSHWNPARPTRIMFEPDALDRMNKFRDDMEKDVLKRDDGELLSAVVARLIDSTAKAATLLAAYDGVEDIHILHALVAIRQGEEWFNNAMRMFSAVSSSDFGRKTEDVKKFILSGKDNSRSQTEIFRRFTFKEAEFNEVVGFLIRSGDIRYVPGSNRAKVEALV